MIPTSWLSVLLLMCSAAASAVELNQLSFPRTYQRYLPALLDGAKLMAASERCNTFIKGGVNIDESREKHPVFYYTCRDAQKQTYSLKVDGLSLEVLDDTRPSGHVSFAQLQREIDQARQRKKQLAAKRQAKINRLQAERGKVREARLQEARKRALRAEAKRRQHLWQYCRAQLAEQMRNMKNFSWSDTQQLEAKTYAGTKKLRFTLDFNAVDLYGQPLHYRAYCTLSNDSDADISIHPRQLELQAAKAQTKAKRKNDTPPKKVTTSLNTQSIDD